MGCSKHGQRPRGERTCNHVRGAESQERLESGVLGEERHEVAKWSQGLGTEAS